MRVQQLSLLPVLSTEQVPLVVERIYQLRGEWTAYKEGSTVFRLGATSNARLPEEEFAAEMRRTRPLLQQHFGDLLENVRRALEPTLQAIRPAPVLFEERLSLPGFHIFLVDEQNLDPLRLHGGFHCDMATFDLDWQPPLPDRMPLIHCISFTLPLVLPPAGGGLLVCEQVTSREVVKYMAQHECDPLVAMHQLSTQHPHVRHAYQIGHMAVHSGQLLHAMSPWSWQPGDVRITLQGHGFLHAGAWRLFW